MDKNPPAVIVIILVLIGLFVFSNLQADAGHLVISQIQITGGTGKTTNDFVEIYNPTISDIDLKGLRLVKRTKTGTTDTLMKSWTSSTIVKARGFYLWANSGFTDISVPADTTTTLSIADDNGVALRNGPNDTGTIIDSVAWGLATNIFIEGSVFATNPSANQILERSPGGDAGNGNDTDANEIDFFLQTSGQPRNSQSQILPIATPIFSTIPSTSFTPTPTLNSTPSLTPTTTPMTVTPSPTTIPSPTETLTLSPIPSPLSTFIPTPTPIFIIPASSITPIPEPIISISPSPTVLPLFSPTLEVTPSSSLEFTPSRLIATIVTPKIIHNRVASIKVAIITPTPSPQSTSRISRIETTVSGIWRLLTYYLSIIRR